MTPQDLVAAKQASLPSVDTVKQFVLGAPAVAATDQARQAFANGNVAGGIGSVLRGAGDTAIHAVGAPIEALGQGVGHIGAAAADAVGRFAGGLLGVQPATALPSQVASADPSLSPIQPAGPAAPARVASPFGVTYDTATGPTLDQAKQITAAQDKQIAGLSGGGMLAPGGQGQSVVGNYTTPVAPAQNPVEAALGLKAGGLHFIMTHPSLAPLASAASTLAGIPAAQDHAAVQKGLFDAVNDRYAQGAGRLPTEPATKAGDDAYNLRRAGDFDKKIKSLLTIFNPAGAQAALANNTFD